jgi:hypothetical protein
MPDVARPAVVAEALERLAPMLPAHRPENVAVIEIAPQGYFLTYGIGIPLMQMRDPALASARVPVT